MVTAINENEFSDITEEGFSIVDFWAEWCSPCRVVAPIFKELAEEYKHISFYKVDIDENQSLAEKFNITSIPAIVFFKNGEMIDKIVGSLPKVNLKNWIDGNVQ